MAIAMEAIVKALAKGKGISSKLMESEAMVKVLTDDDGIGGNSEGIG